MRNRGLRDARAARSKSIEESTGVASSAAKGDGLPRLRSVVKRNVDHSACHAT